MSPLGVKPCAAYSFATVADGVATFCDWVVGGSYKVMLPGQTVTLANEGDTITLDMTLTNATVTTTAENCEVTQVGNVYTVTRKTVDVNPGDSHESTALTEEEAKAEVEISVDPNAKTDLATAGVSEETYKGYFHKRVTGTSGDYTVTVELSPVTTNDVQKSIDKEVKVLDMTNSVTEVSVSMPSSEVKPGLYYGIAVATEVGSVKATDPEEWKMATSEGVSLKADKPEGDKAFFLIKCSPVDTTKKN